MATSSQRQRTEMSFTDRPAQHMFFIRNCPVLYIVLRSASHFTKAGRIVQGENLDVTTLEQAIREGWRLLTEKTPADDMDGFEIWQCATLLYSSADGTSWPALIEPVEAHLSWRPQLSDPDDEMVLKAVRRSFLRRTGGFGRIYSMKLKNMLRRVHSNSTNLLHGTVSFV
jgi:hypothetical protein